jgi:hypothetical protein
MRTVLLAAAIAVSVSAAGAQSKRPAAGSVLPPMTVYRVQSCGCCLKWVDHLRAAGFDVTVNVVPSLDQAPNRSRVPQPLRSCHMGVAGGYAIEGHIPADVVKAFLKKKPKADGIAVPGMPAGSPGMESPYPVAYDVIAFDPKGTTSVFTRVEPKR